MKRLSHNLLILLASCAVANADSRSFGIVDIITGNLPQGPLAEVDGVPIDRQDFIYAYSTQVTSKGGLSNEARILAAERTLDYLIRREILFQEGVKRGFSLSDSELDDAFDSNAANLRAAFDRAGQRGITNSGLLGLTGRDREFAIRSLSKTGVVMKVYAEFAESAASNITEADIEAFHREHNQRYQAPAKIHLKEIYVNPGLHRRETRENARRIAQVDVQKAMSLLRSGQRFSAVAQRYSNASSSKNGGDMGALSIDVIPPRLLEEAKKLEPGNTSSVIETENGFHILQLVDRQSATTRSVDEVRAEIVAAIKISRADRAIEDFCARVSKSERVRVHISFGKERHEQ
jgi:parvulin-like peptidyl-prolyl isomerase